MNRSSRAAVVMILAVVWIVVLGARLEWWVLPDMFGPPPGDKIAVVVYESEDRTPELWQLLDEIRSMPERPGLETLMIDQTVQEDGFAEDVVEELDGTCPGVVIGSRITPTEMKVIYSGPLPETFDGFVELIESKGG